MVGDSAFCRFFEHSVKILPRFCVHKLRNYKRCTFWVQRFCCQVYDTDVKGELLELNQSISDHDVIRIFLHLLYSVKLQKMQWMMMA